MTADWFGWLCRVVGVCWVVAGLLVGQAVMLPLGAVLIGLGQALGTPRVRALRDPDALSPNPPGWDAAVAEYVADPDATVDELEARWPGPRAPGEIPEPVFERIMMMQSEGLSTRGEWR